MKRLFKYDFLDKNTGIQSAIIAIVVCLMVGMPKQIIQSMGVYLIIGVIVYPIVLLGGLALLDKQLSKKNFSDSQLSLFNKIGFGVCCICFAIVLFIRFFR